MADKSLEVEILFVFIIELELDLLPGELYGIFVSENTEGEGNIFLLRMKMNFSLVDIRRTVFQLTLQVGIWVSF